MAPSMETAGTEMYFVPYDQQGWCSGGRGHIYLPLSI